MVEKRLKIVFQAGCLILIHLVCFTVAMAQQQVKLLKQLEIVEKNLFQDPASTKIELKKFILSNPNASDSIKGLAYGGLAIAMGMTNEVDSAIWAAKESIRLLSDSSQAKADGLKTLAILYRIKGDFAAAQKSIEQSIDLNNRYWKDDKLQVLNYQEFASLMLDQNNFYDATTLYLKALEIWEKTDDNPVEKSKTMAKLHVNLAEAYVKSRNFDFAINEFNSALPTLDSLKEDEFFIRSSIKLAEAYIETGKTKDAEKVLSKIESKLQKFDNDELMAYLFLKKAQLHTYQQNHTTALPLLRSAFQILEKNQSPVILECGNAYLKALQKTGNSVEAQKLLQNQTLLQAVENGLKADRLEFKKVALDFVWQNLSTSQLHQYTKELISLNDSVALELDEVSASQIQAQYQFKRQQEQADALLKENRILRQNEEFKRNQFYFLVAITLLSTTILGLMVQRMRLRSAAKDRALQAKDKELLFEKSKSEWAEREKDLREKLIEQQKSELVRSMEDSQELRSKLELLVAEQQQERRKELSENFEKSRNEKLGMDQLLSHFNAVYPTFSASLVKKYPKLSQSDVQFCTMTRMNLTSKEISTLFNIELRSVYARKYRIMEKMGLSDDDNFEQVLAGIE